MKKVIVFNCVDNFGRVYTTAVSCKPEDEAEAIKWAESRSTEIIGIKCITVLTEYNK